MILVRLQDNYKSLMKEITEDLNKCKEIWVHSLVDRSPIITLWCWKGQFHQCRRIFFISFLLPHAALNFWSPCFSNTPSLPQDLCTYSLWNALSPIFSWHRSLTLFRSLLRETFLFFYQWLFLSPALLTIPAFITTWRYQYFSLDICLMFLSHWKYKRNFVLFTTVSPMPEIAPGP